jgi:4-deoxy-L-threo-5-hexosulose-uronate ketol-isomerase
MMKLETADAIRYRTMTKGELRAAFVPPPLFSPGRITLVATDVDRAIVGGAVPTAEPLPLDAPAALRAAAFCERRELGVLNLGAPGRVHVDGQTHALERRGCLYVGRGARSVVFESDRRDDPATFYLVSFPAHASHPTTAARTGDARRIALGTLEEANRRTIYQYIHPEGIRSCQLVMGFTELEPGGVWNTMPPHGHDRRCEIYLYFDVPAEARVFHFMGTPEETRPLVLADREAVVAPAWSLHFGVGTRAYRFAWAMGGENQAFDDMDAVPLARLG